MATDTITEEQAQKELITKLNLTYTCEGGASTWGRTSFQFDILFGRFQQPFQFFGSVVDYQNDKQTLSDYDLLFAYRCIISDAFCVVEVGNDKNEFLSMFGYLDEEYRGLSENELEYTLNSEDMDRFNNGLTAWVGCKSAYKRLNKSDDDLIEILDTLQELGIE